MRYLMLYEGFENKLRGVGKDKYDVDSIFKHPFCYAYLNLIDKIEEDNISDCGDIDSHFRFSDGLKTVLVSHDKIYPTQNVVYRASLHAKLDGIPEYHENDILPYGYLLKNSMVLLGDGHHRVAADILLGKKNSTILLDIEHATTIDINDF